MSKLDLNKPIETRIGSPARVICTDLQDKHYKWAVAVKDDSGKEELYYYTNEGKFNFNVKKHHMDLVNPKNKKYINLHMDIDTNLVITSSIFDNIKEVEKNKEVSKKIEGIKFLGTFTFKHDE